MAVTKAALGTGQARIMLAMCALQRPARLPRSSPAGARATGGAAAIDGDKSTETAAKARIGHSKRVETAESAVTAIGIRL